MKTMTCEQLGGACDKAFHAETFEEMAEMSKNHGMEMFQEGEPAHLAAMEKMKEIMQRPNSMQDFIEGKRKEFDALPSD